MIIIILFNTINEVNEVNVLPTLYMLSYLLKMGRDTLLPRLFMFTVKG